MTDSIFERGLVEFTVVREVVEAPITVNGRTVYEESSRNVEYIVKCHGLLKKEERESIVNSINYCVDRFIEDGYFDCRCEAYNYVLVHMGCRLYAIGANVHRYCSRMSKFADVDDNVRQVEYFILKNIFKNA